MSWQKAVQAALVANVPVLIEGDPGIGKTSYIYALADALGMHAEVVIASLREPSDFLGLPVIREDRVEMAAPQWAHRLGKAVEAGRGALLVLDEITTAPPAVQAALLRVVLEKVVGDLSLPKEVRVIAIANPSEQAGGWDLSLPLSNRFLHVRATAPDAKEWAKGLVDSWQTPPEISRLHVTMDSTSRAKSLVGGFLAHRSALLLAVPDEKSKDRSAWPSPRSWDNATRLAAVALAENGKDLLTQVISGTVGPGAAKEFITWFNTLDLPDPEEVLSKPHKFRVPDRIDKVFVVLDGVSSFAANRIKALSDDKAIQVWEAAWEVLGAVCEAGMPDVALVAAKKVISVRRDTFPLPHKRIAAFADLLTGLE